MVDVPEESTRLSKVVAALMPCSRREAEQYIAEGWVRVDGKVVEEPHFRVTNQRVEIDPRAILQPPTPATFLMNKPPGMSTAQVQASLSAATHWQADASGVRRVKSHHVGLRVLLELPPQAEGLCIFSQDARIVRKLHEDAQLIEQELLAEVTGTIAPDGLSLLRGGLLFEGRRLPPVRASWQSEARLRLAGKGIRVERVPWMCAQIGLELRALKRIRIGRVPMAGLPPGHWRYLAPSERF